MPENLDNENSGECHQSNKGRSATTAVDCIFCIKWLPGLISTRSGGYWVFDFTNVINSHEEHSIRQQAPNVKAASVQKNMYTVETNLDFFFLTWFIPVLAHLSTMIDLKCHTYINELLA